MRPDILNPLFAEVTALKGVRPAARQAAGAAGAGARRRRRVPSADRVDRPAAARGAGSRPMSGGSIAIALTPVKYRIGGSARAPARVQAVDAQGNYVTPGLLRRQFGLGEEAAAAERAALGLGQARPIWPGAADRPSRPCRRARRGGSRRGARRSIRCSKGSPRSGSRRWRRRAIGARAGAAGMDRAEPEGAARLAGLAGGAGADPCRSGRCARRASGWPMTRCSPTSSR